MISKPGIIQLWDKGRGRKKNKIEIEYSEPLTGNLDCTITLYLIPSYGETEIVDITIWDGDWDRTKKEIERGRKKFFDFWNKKKY